MNPYDLLILGRTERAWGTHCRYQGETERLFNRVIALVAGKEWDTGAGARGVSRRAAESLLELAQEPTVGPDAEWPLLLTRDEGYLLGHRLCEGLEFETADCFRPEIEAVGGHGAWQAHINAGPGAGPSTWK